MTIEEMAEKYANDAYSHPVDINVGKADFILGANAVLKEIEDELNKQPLKFGRTWRSMYNKLNELKGKE